MNEPPRVRARPCDCSALGGEVAGEGTSRVRPPRMQPGGGVRSDEARPGIVADDRGAVLVIGLFFAMFLTGTLWYLYGLTQSIIYRVHNQEAADAVALTSAIVHARGMNFIAVCNLSMIGMVAYWRVLMMWQYLLSLTMLFTGPSQLFTCQERNPITAPQDDCKAASESESVYNQILTILPRYTAVMKATLVALSQEQVAMADSGALLGAQASAKEIASRYNVKGETFSSPMILSGLLDGKGTVRGGQAKAWIGLPIDSVPFITLCIKTHPFVYPVVYQKASIYTPDVIAMQNNGNTSIPQDLAGTQGLSLQQDLTLFCTDPFWSTSGPKIIPDGASNGGDWMQVWGLVPEGFTDGSDNIVGLASRKGASSGQPPPLTEATYFAQAEYYYDCADSWGSAACNGATDDAFTLYSMRWRARLKKMQMTAFGTDITRFVGPVSPVAGRGWPFTADGTTSPATIFH